MRWVSCRRVYCYLLPVTCYLLLVGETRWMEMKETGKGNRGMPSCPGETGYGLNIGLIHEVVAGHGYRETKRSIQLVHNIT